MTTDPSPIQHAAPRTATTRPWTWPLRVGLMTVFLLFVVGGPIEQLLLGWIYFPIRVLPRMVIDWPTAILGLVSSIAFVAGLHFTIRWFVQQRTFSVARPQNWSLRSSCVVAATLVLMFGAGTAMVGTAHQTIWLLSSRDSRSSDDEIDAGLPSLMRAINGARDATRWTQTKIALKQLGLGMGNFVDVFGGFPPGGIVLSDGTLMHGWAICPQMYSHYYDDGKMDYSIPWNKSPNDLRYQCELSEFTNASLPGPYFDERGYGLNHLAANMYVFPVRIIEATTIDGKASFHKWSEQLKVNGHLMSLSDITDGTSNTIMLGTVRERFKPWGHPANIRDPALGINRSPDGFGGPRQWRGGMFLMCDGSVQFLNESIDPTIMRALGTPAGGESIPPEVGDFPRR